MGRREQQSISQCAADSGRDDGDPRWRCGPETRARPGLAARGSQPQLATSDVTLRFGDDSNLSGKAVLNTYSGTFAASEDGSLRLGPIARTEIGGDPGPDGCRGSVFRGPGLVDGFDSNGDELFLRTGDTTIPAVRPARLGGRVRAT